MSNKIVLIETSSPLICHSVDGFYDLALALSRAGLEVKLLLIGDGVAPLRGGPYLARLSALQEEGVDLFADGDAMERRAVHLSSPSPLAFGDGADHLASLLVQGYKVIWHGHGHG